MTHQADAERAMADQLAVRELIAANTRGAPAVMPEPLGRIAADHPLGPDAIRGWVAGLAEKVLLAKIAAGRDGPAAARDSVRVAAEFVAAVDEAAPVL